MTDDLDVRARWEQLTLAIDLLRPHPHNYRTHTEDQLAHLRASVQDFGIYRNVVVARDNTILAGHGVVLAARQLQMTDIPVVRVDLDPDDPRALKLLVGDNQIAQLAAIDDRQLTEMLKIIRDDELVGLLGTGYDLQQLAALVMVTRPASEIQDFDAAAEWVGLPETGTEPIKSLIVVVHCLTEEDRQDFFDRLQATPQHIAGTKVSRSIWWPLRARVKERASFDG